LPGQRRLVIELLLAFFMRSLLLSLKNEAGLSRE